MSACQHVQKALGKAKWGSISTCIPGHMRTCGPGTQHVEQIGACLWFQGGCHMLAAVELQLQSLADQSTAAQLRSTSLHQG